MNSIRRICPTIARRRAAVAALLAARMMEAAAMSAPVDNSFGDLALTEDEAVEQTTPICQVLPCEGAPRLDGRLDEPAWAQANRFVGFVDNDARRYAARQTAVSLLYDREALYVALESELPPAPSGGEQVCAVILRPPGAARATTLRIASGGGLTDADGQAVAAAVASAASSATDGRWTVELAIRFAGLGTAAPAGRESWDINFCRWWPDPVSRTSWVAQRLPRIGGAEAGEMGRLVFRREGPILRIETFGQLEQRLHGLACDIRVASEDDGIYVLSDALRQGLVTRGAHTEKPVAGRFYRLAVTTNQVGTQAIREAEFLAYSFVDKTLSRAYFRSDRFPVGNPPPLRIQSASFEEKNRLRVTANTWGLPPGEVGKAAVRVALLWEDREVRAARAEGVRAISASVDFPLRDLEPGVAYRMRAALTAGDGRLLGTAEEIIEYPDTTRWLGNKLGLDEVVPAPFEPVRVTDASIACWGRAYRFGPGLALPTQIVTRGASILAAPSRLEAVVAGQPVVWRMRDGTYEQRGDTAADYVVAMESDELTITSRATVEYDGMVRLDMTVTPARPLTLDRLVLTVPLARRHARYLGVTDCESQRTGYYGALPAEGYACGFKPFVWLGDEDRGLLWFSESARGWAASASGAAIQAVPEGERIDLRLTIIGASVRLDQPRVYTMGLQASPVRPLPPNWRACETNWVFGPTTMEHFAYIPECLKAWTNLLAKAKAQGKMISAYTFLNNVSTRLPEYNFFFDDWKRERFASKSKYYADVVAPNVRSWQDFIVWSFQKGLDDFDIDGLYYDLAWPSPTTSPDHGGYTGGDGKPGKSWPIFALRAIARRAYVAFRARKKQTVFIGHCSGNAITLPILSFCDMALDGEQFAHHLQTGYMDQVPLDKMRTEFTGRQFGLMPLFLPSLSKSGNRDYTEKTEAPTVEMAALWYLHDAMIWKSFCNGPVLAKFQDAKMAFVNDPGAAVEFLPYWSDAGAPRAIPESVKVSAYRKPGACLMMIVNTSPEPADAVLTLDARALGFTGGMRASDAVNGAVIPVGGGRLSLPVKGRWLRMIRLEPAES